MKPLTRPWLPNSKRRTTGDLPANWAAESAKIIETLQANPAKIATRKASQNSLEAFGEAAAGIHGGSADLAPSNLTMWSGSKSLTPESAAGNYIHYGVREFGMSAIMNGIALHGGFIPYGATFLMFMEYARNALRMAALMKQRAIFVYPTTPSVWVKMVRLTSRSSRSPPLRLTRT